MDLNLRDRAFLNSEKTLALSKKGSIVVNPPCYLKSMWGVLQNSSTPKWLTKDIPIYPNKGYPPN